MRSGRPRLCPIIKAGYLLPSVVNYHASGLTVGYDARLNAAQDPANTISSVKRMMGRSPPIFKTVTRICRISCRPVKTACR
ncbi:Chaperone protein HscA [Klebsiella pneumoniae]|uniref:Chaperone protein HscA n=1 Tax=Klebsiella pneumoniae TaxID=573 RepID=A0A2X1QIK7_KLEPN|nr:Chaperone protein HscA [Klebsiella pneumoniae]